MQIFKHGTIECWLFGNEYYVYGVTMSGDPRIVPSEGMARELTL